MKVVYLTAGAAGMYCGSCMHDNSLARAMRELGIDCVLQPVYTPIRTDELSEAGPNVFLGGIHVYLLQLFPWLRWLPRPLRGFVDFPPLIRWATRRAGSTDPAVLGDLSVSMLRGEHGNQAQEFARLNDWLVNEMQPDAIILTNLLIGGGLPEVKRRLPKTKVIVMLQGDDIFLDHLPDAARTEAIRLCSELVNDVDLFCVHSRFYGDKMGTLLGIPTEKLRITPLTIDVHSYPEAAHPREIPDDFHLGFFARIAPEKGLHHLAEAFIKIATQDPSIHLHAAGWLGPANEPYLKSVNDRLRSAGLLDRFTYHGSPDLKEKIAFLKSMDLLSVPTQYEDPKGLFLLEALAVGTPVVMPNHGAFGELLASTGGGKLVPPHDPDALAEAILELRHDPDRRNTMAQEAMKNVREKHSIHSSAEELSRWIAP